MTLHFGKTIRFVYDVGFGNAAEAMRLGYDAKRSIFCATFVEVHSDSYEFFKN